MIYPYGEPGAVLTLIEEEKERREMAEKPSRNEPGHFPEAPVPDGYTQKVSWEKTPAYSRPEAVIVAVHGVNQRQDRVLVERNCLDSAAP